MNRRLFQGGGDGTCVRKAGVVYCSGMSKKQPKPPKREQTEKEPRRKTPTFLLELPLQVDAGQAARLRADSEAGRQFYNAVLSEGLKRLRRMRADAAWQEARAIPRTQKQERARAFRATAPAVRIFRIWLACSKPDSCAVCWIAEHLDAVLAQTLASRAYRALARLCLGQARRVRFKSRGRASLSIENKRNDTGLRFVLQKPEEGNQGFLIWKDDNLVALIDWNDPVVKQAWTSGSSMPVSCSARPAVHRPKELTPRGFATLVQLALEGMPYHKPKHPVGRDIIGADVGPSTIALVPRRGGSEPGPVL